MSITCFPSNDNTYLNHNNNHEQTNSNNNSNLIAASINTTTTSTNQFRQKLLNNNNQSTTDLNSSINHNLLNNNIIQNSKSDHMISCFDTFQPVSRTTTPISYLTTNSSLDGYFALNTSSNQHLNSQLLNNNLNRCHSSNSNCSTNSKLNNSSLISSRPASSLDNFLILSNDSDDSTQANNNQQLAQQLSTNQTSVLSYYPHIIRNENNFNNNSNSNSTLLQQSNQTTTTIHHSSNFHQQSSNQVKEEFNLDQQSNYHQNTINFQATNNNDVQVLSNLNSSLNTSNNHINQLNNRIQQDDLQLPNSNLDQFSNSSSSSNSNNKSNNMNSGKKRRNKLNGGPPARPQCAECGKDFSNQSALSKHKLTHSEERKFVCQICQKGFKRQDHLTGHLFTHRDKKPYQCDVKNCEKTYCDARSLKRHKENHHHSILNHLTLPLGKNLTVDLLNAAVKASSDGSRIQYAPAPLSENSNELELNNTILDSNSIDRSQLLQLINQVDGDSAAAISLLQQLNEQETNSAKCPTCSKKFKNVPALNGHMRLHGGFYRSNQQQTNNENSNQRSSTTVQQSTSNQAINNNKNELHQSNNRNDGPIDLIKKESLFVDRTNQNNQQQQQQTIQSNNQQRDINSNIVKDKIRKHIANTPVIIENPNNNSESNRFQQQPQQQLINNNRVQYFAPNETSQNNNLLTTSVINTNNNPYLSNSSNKSPLTTDHQQLQLDNNHSSPINNELIQQQQRNEQDLLNNNQQDKQQVVHDSSWFDDQNNVLHLKEQLQQQLEFRTPNSSAIQNKIINQSQHLKQPNNQNLVNNRIPAIPAHVFSNGEKFRRHSDSTAEILNQQNISHQTNYLHHQQQQSNLLNQDQIHTQAMNSNSNLNQEQLQPINYEITNNLNNQIENNNNNNNNNLINFEYPKRKLVNHRIENETNTNETIPESQLINSTSSVQNYLSTTTTVTNHLQQTNQFYSNSNNCNNNQLAAYQSHSVPTTPTINQNFFNNNQRIDLNGVNQQLNHSNYNNSINSNQISHHSNQHLTVNNHSLPNSHVCTPKQSTSFTFSPHHVEQHYQQQNQQQSNYHNNHQFNSSPNTPHTPITPVTPTSNCNQYQDNLIMGRSSNLQHPQTIQSNQLNTINNKNLYPATIDYSNNTICTTRSGKFNESQNVNSYNNMINNQYLETNDNLNNSDHLSNSNNNNYSSTSATNLINDNYLLNNSNTFNNTNQNQFNNCQQLNNNSNYQINNIICPNDNSNTYSHQQPVIMNNYSTNDTAFTCDNQSNQNNNLLNDELIKNNPNSTTINNDNKIVNCQQQSSTNLTPEKQQFKRATLDSSSPTLFIATDSYKNSTADDSQTFPNINEEDNEDDDVFLAPASPAPIKSNFNFNNKKNKPFNLSSGTFLNNNSNNLNHHIRQSNLPQCVDFTHPQQPKLSTTGINLNRSNNKLLKDEESLNDINFNSIKAVNNNNYNSSTNLNNNKLTKDNKPKNSSPKRTKHRPEPLYIPPHVNARHKTTRPLFAATLGLDGFNPPPYTPPPMLSPVRTNSSYYWHILTGNLTPKTITNFFSNRTSMSKNLDQQSTAIINNQNNNNTATTNNLNNNNIINNNKKLSFEFFNNQNDISTPGTAYEPIDSCLPDVESTFDFSSYSSQNAHVNIGKSYQARIPAFNPNKEDALSHYKNEKADKLWSPSILDNLTISELSTNDNQLNNDKQFNILNSKRKTNLLKELDLYFDLSCSACVKGNGRNVEYAYHILFQNNGDLNKSIKQLLNSEPEIKPDNPLYNYKYNETDLWTDEEIQLYYEALLKYDKDFLTISKQIKNKSVKQCIEFYYLWKKIRSEEYKKHRQLRRKKEQEGIYCINVK